MRRKKLRLKKSIKTLILSIIQLVIICNINNYSINDLYNELYFNIIFITSIIFIEIIKNIID